MCETCDKFKQQNERIGTIEQKLEKISDMCSQILQSGMLKQIFSVKEAAALIGKSPFTVSAYCRKGKIIATRTGDEGMWMIPAASLQQFTGSQTKN